MQADIITTATCPNCGTPSGAFADPRVALPGSFLGHYHCAQCNHRAPLIDVLRAADDKVLESWLAPPDTQESAG